MIQPLLLINRRLKNMNQLFLKELLHYDPETGIFRWNKQRRNIKLGEVAGGRNSIGYIFIRLFYNRFLAHRLAWMYMYGNFPPDEIDHINGVRDDNRIINLRAVSHAENAKNQRINSTNTSGVTGVSWNKAAQKWKAQVRQDNKTLYFGIYSNFLDAICARKSAEHILGFHPNHGK